MQQSFNCKQQTVFIDYLKMDFLKINLLLTYLEGDNIIYVHLGINDIQDGPIFERLWITSSPLRKCCYESLHPLR